MMHRGKHISVRNLSDQPQHFFFYLEQPDYDQNGAQSLIYNFSLGCQRLGNYDETGAYAKFFTQTKFYAAACHSGQPIKQSHQLQCLSANSATAAFRKLYMTDKPLASRNNMQLRLDPLGLTSPLNDLADNTGEFVITVPPYQGYIEHQISIGCAIEAIDGSLQFTSLLNPQPNQQLRCKPKAIYYVGIGHHLEGEIFEYKPQESYRCDFTNGEQNITINYNKTGKFELSDFRAIKKAAN